MPICRPSGEQIDWPGEVQEPVEEPVDVLPEPEAVAAPEPEELSEDTGVELAVGDDEEGKSSGELAATEGEAATPWVAADVEGAMAGGAAARDDTAAASPEFPEPPAIKASVFGDPADELPEAPHFGPVGGAKTFALLALAFSTDDPGSGNFTSAPCAVVQSDTGMFAMNISGKEAVARSESS